MSAPFGGGPLRIITADERLREARGIKGVLTGTSGIGKTTQLLTLDPQRTLFLNLEAGELAVQGWPGDEIRIRDWEVARDLAAWIGGANPAMRDDQSYGPAHFARVCAAFGPATSSTNTTPSSSTASRSPRASACSGARASPRRSRIEPASPIFAPPTGCSARR